MPQPRLVQGFCSNCEAFATFKVNYVARLISMGVDTRFVVCGNPDLSINEALVGFEAIYVFQKIVRRYKEKI